jgi:D-alanyl-lipoteichoic acid acyltransferase DltB (MBOAT superfamily)
MAVGSLEFFIALALASAIVPLLPTVRLRQLALAGCSAGFLATLVPNAASWLALATFVLSGFVLARILGRRPSTWIAGSYLVALLLAFLVLKKYSILAWVLPAAVLDHPVGIVGLSYILFRQIHFLVDCMQAQIVRPRLWDYLNYQLNVFMLVAGPIQRFQDFTSSWQRLEPLPADRHETLCTWLRILLGAIKIAGIAAVCLFAHAKIREHLLHYGGPVPPLEALLQFAALFYLYPLYLYFNFSGYCDIVIGAGALFGVAIPENFDRPYLSRNLLDFWTRWHQTLGLWIRDYLFMPAYKAIAERMPARAPSLAFACYFMAFLLAGVWHGSTSNFVVFGLIHGVGASAVKLWEQFLVKRKGRAYLKQYMQSGRIRLVAILLTLHYAGFALLFFSDELEDSLIPLQIVAASLWRGAFE